MWFAARGLKDSSTSPQAIQAALEKGQAGSPASRHVRTASNQEVGPHPRAVRER